MKKNIKIIETLKGKIEFLQEGEGTPILKIHGSLSNCFDEMGNKSFIEAGHSIIVPSRPGYGKTPLTSGKSAEQAADLLNELLNYLYIDSLNVIAISSGGLTGLYFAAKYPEKVRKLILESAVSQKLFADQETYDRAVKFYSNKFLWGILNVMAKFAKKSLVKKTLEIFSTCDTEKIMKEVTKEDIDEIIKFYQKKLESIGALNDMEHIITDDVFNRVQAPTLIVHSKADASVPFTHAENAYNKINGSELFIANTWGHSIIRKGSEEVYKKIIDFLGQ